MELKNGLYIECSFDQIAIDSIYKQYAKAGLKFLLDPKKAHTTICYSKTLPKKEFKLRDLKGEAKPDGLTIFPKGDDGYPLVLKLKSKALLEQHKFYQKEYKLSYDYPEYIPHITISYDIEKSLGITIGKEGTDCIEKVLNSLEINLPGSIRITNQSGSDLNKDWVEDHGVENEDGPSA